MAKAERNAMARRHLDARINKQTPAEKLTRPPRGWIKAIREALGMTTAQLARRMEISQPGVVVLERSEAAGTIKLDTLQRAAAALNCRLVYALVPDEPLGTMVRERARQLAQRHLGTVEHTMRLENQGIEDLADREQQLDIMASQIAPRILWDEP
ncbi:mobile mystery protein A [Telmatospirillum sp.]|uniref:mobile mystery protein A n=1 Tax=Telmatospirillum sp. TaxID=2079197 RepID=UPI002843C650|nr:mobile mystery protein A [Telmatospirillum sp.]MDR3440599.1 mobile mystery protein A [Telmatospirillum sp.]